MSSYVFTVSGCGSFPFKMLVRDEAWPASEDDAERLEYACPTQAPRVTLKLRSHRRPNTGLWRDHKWPVQKVEL